MNTSMNAHSTRIRYRQGFTLIEVMVVLVMLSLFAGMIALSVNGSSSRKNQAFYEHLIDSMHYLRLVSAERMQPIGISITADQDTTILQVIKLDNAYSTLQPKSTQDTNNNRSKNAMELSANIRQPDAQSNEPPKPTWVVDDSITLPTIPDNVTITAQPLNPTDNGRQLQPWFSGQDVPDFMWYGNGQATSVNIEVKYNDRLVGNVIQLSPNGSITNNPE